MALARRSKEVGAESGFSIIELLVVMVIMTVIVAASIPALKRHTADLNLTKGSEALASSLKLARTRAVSTNRQVVVVFNGDTGRYFLFEDDDEDGTWDSNEAMGGPYEVPNKIVMSDVSFARQTVTFSPDGSASETGSVELANTRHLAQRIDLIDATGLVYVSDVYPYEGELIDAE
jgi:type II secretion system protein H